MGHSECDIFTFIYTTRKLAMILMFGATFYYLQAYNDVGKMRYIDDDNHDTRQSSNKSSDSRVHKVLFFSYIRGGSSIGSEIFDLDNRSLLWYEPLDPFYFSNTGYFGRKCQKVYLDESESMIRPLHEWELSRMIQFLADLYECRMGALPSELRVHRFLMHTSALRSYTSCYEHNSADSMIWDLIYCRRMLHTTCGMSVDNAIANRCHDVMDAVHSASYIDFERPSRTADFRLSESEQRDVITSRLIRKGFGAEWLNASLPDILRYRSCLDDLEEISAACLPFATYSCPKSTIRTAKIVRATMQPIRSLLDRIPDLRVILFVRDPRAVAFSRSSNAKPKNQILRNFLKLCLKMRADLYFRQQLEQAHPGSVTLVRYEDFVERPKFWIREMYRHIGVEVPREAAHRLVHTRLYAGSDDGLKYGNVRANATEIAYKWLPLVAPDLMFRMQRACPDVLDTLKYPFY